MAQIHFGEFNGVTVHDTKDNAVVEISKFEQKVAAQFKGKVQGGFYSSYLTDKSVVAADGNVLLAVSKNFLRSDDQIRDFNHRVAEAIATHTKINADFEAIHDIVKFDMGGDKKVVPRYGQDSYSKNPAPGQDAAPENAGQKKNWAFGTVINRNDNYVAFDAGSTQDVQFVRILPIDKFLLNKDEEKNAKQVLDERLKVGEYKRLSWFKEDENTPTKIKVETAIKREAKQAQAPVQKDLEKAEDRKQAVQDVAAEMKLEGEAPAKTPAKRKKKEQSIAA